MTLVRSRTHRILHSGSVQLHRVHGLHWSVQICKGFLIGLLYLALQIPQWCARFFKKRRKCIAPLLPDTKQHSWELQYKMVVAHSPYLCLSKHEASLKARDISAVSDAPRYWLLCLPPPLTPDPDNVIIQGSSSRVPAQIKESPSPEVSWGPKHC